MLSAAINFLIVAAVIYFIIVVALQEAKNAARSSRQDTELSLLTEIRDLLAEKRHAGKQVTGPGTGPSPDTAETTSADRD